MREELAKGEEGGALVRGSHKEDGGCAGGDGVVLGVGGGEDKGLFLFFIYQSWWLVGGRGFCGLVL